MTLTIDAEENQAEWIRDERAHEDPVEERLVEAMATKLAGTEKAWIPYEGPQGGEGWQNVETGDIEYTDEPPGEAITAEDVAEAAADAGVPPGEIEDVVGDAAALGPSGDTRSPDDLMDDISMAVAEQHLEEVMTGGGTGETYIDLANARSDNRDEYLEELRSILEDSLTDDQKRALAAEAGVDDAYAEVDPDDVEGDPERAQRALEAIDDSDTSALTDRAEKVLRDKFAQDASRARHDETVDRLAGHTEEFRNADERSGDLKEGRAAYHTSASRSGTGDPSNHMYLAGDTSGRTVSHEFAHGLADAFAFDTITGTSVSHRYPDEGLPDWDFGPPDPSADQRTAVVSTGPDDGYEHARKRQYMLNKFPDWEEREPKGWDEWAERGEPVDKEDLSPGDRVALRSEPHKGVSVRTAQREVQQYLERRDADRLREIADEMGLDHPAFDPDRARDKDEMLRAFEGEMGTAEINEYYDRLEGAATEGSVVPATNPVKSADELEPGDSLDLDRAEHLDGKYWGVVNEDIGETEVDEVVEMGDWIVISEDGTYPLPEGADPGEYETRPEVHDVIEASADGALVTGDDGATNYAKVGDIDKHNGEPDLVVRDPKGDEHPLDGPGDMLRMADAESRDWVDTRGRRPDRTWRGETVRVSFGASDDKTEGVVVDETNSQCTIAYRDGNGNHNTKTINKSNAYNQQLEFAQDKEEFQQEVVDPDREPPGLREAQYDMVDLNEAEVDWDTSVQYDDPGERLEQLSVGDIALVKGPGGDRHVVRVDDAFEPFSEHDGPALEIQGTVGNGSEASNTNGLLDAGQRMVLGEGDFSLMGLSDKEQWVDESDAERAAGSVGIREEDVEINAVENLLDLDAPPGQDDLYDFRVTMPDPDGGTMRLDGRVDEFDNNIMFRRADGTQQFFVDMEPDERPPPVRTTGPVDERETVGSITDIMTAETGPTIEGGFEPDDPSDLEEGMVAEVELPAAREGGPEDEARDGFDASTMDPVNLHEAAADALYSDPDDPEVQQLYGRLKGMDAHVERNLQTALEDIGYEGRDAERRASLLENRIDSLPDYDNDIIVEEVESVNDDTGQFVTESGATHRFERLRKAADTSRDPSAPPEDAEEAVENLMAEVNKAWHKMVTKHEREGDPDSSLHIDGAYSETNAHETLAKTHETLQDDDGTFRAKNIAKNHPGLLDAYTDLFDISEANKEKINEEYNKNPYAFEYSETPFPEVAPAEVDPYEAFTEGMEIETGDYFGGTVEVQSVVEGDLLVETPNGNEEWLNPSEAAHMVGIVDEDEEVKIV